MDTLLIELTNQKAYKLIQELEELHILRVLKKNKSTKKKEKLSEKYAGKLSPDVAAKMQQYIKKSRKEWSQRGI